MNNINRSKLFAFFFAVLLSISIFIFRDSIIKLQTYGYIGLFLLNILGSATIFLPTPLFLTAFAASAFLNPWIVTIVTSLGSALGEVTGYMMGYGGEQIINKSLHVKKVKGWMNKYSLWTIFVLAAIPNPLFDIAGIIAGSTRIPLTKFLSVVWAGKLIKFGIIAFLGANSLVLIGTLF